MTYTAIPYAMLIEGCPSHDVGFQAVIDFGHELEGQSLVFGSAVRSMTGKPRPISVRSERTFKMVVAGMQCVSKSYSFARTCRIRAGDRSAMISFAMTSIRASQSGGGIGVLSFTLSLSPSVSLFLPP